MRDVKFHTGLEGEPLVTVTLDAVEVQAITSSMYTRAQEHTKSVFDMIASGKAKQNAEYRGVEAQSESQRNAGEWLFIQGQVEEPFWAWVNETDAEYQDASQAN